MLLFLFVSVHVCDLLNITINYQYLLIEFFFYLSECSLSTGRCICLFSPIPLCKRIV